MKIFSSQFSKTDEKTVAKSAVIRKSGKRLSLVRHYTTDAENIGTLSRGATVMIATDYLDAINETLQMPPVKGSATFRIIAGNKLKDNLDASIEYIMAYKQNTLAEKQQGLDTYNVHLMPRSVFTADSAYLTSKYSVHMYTVSAYALCALTDKYFPGKTVFHAYADGTTVTAAVCRDDMILYTRSTNVQKSDDLSGAYYEYLNLTYMYAVKNLKLDISNVIFSGDMSNAGELTNTFREFSGKPISTLSPTGIIDNCSYAVFQKFLIPISLCYLCDDYDMTPQDIKEAQGRTTLTSLANIAAILLVCVLALMNLAALDRLDDTTHDMITQKDILSHRISEYRKAIYDIQDKKFGLYYYSEARRNADSAAALFPDFARLLTMGHYDSVVFATEPDGRKSLTLSGDAQFRKLSTMEAFKDRYASNIAKLTATGKYTIEDTTTLTPDQLRIKVSVKFTTKGPVQGAKVD